MATLVLTLVGTYLGGPVGGSIGAAIGQQIDARIFAPKARQGPRLSDLNVQSSSYGAQIPQLFGRNRVSGSVIWATDLVEHRQKQSSGKGQPKQVSYSYTASFAVALSARGVARIGRIWADGNLLRGEAGDFKTATQFRFYTGGEGQAVDPLIASAEGPGNCPAYRGLAYAVFEDMELADFGNRIPSLSFEVIADEAPVSIGTILAQSAGRGLEADCPTLVDGLAVQGSTLRGLAETLSSVVPLHAGDRGGTLIVREAALSTDMPDPEDLGTAPGSEKTARFDREQMLPSAQPLVNALAYHDVSRDYQVGLQRARIVIASARTEASEFAGSLTPSRARALVERLILAASARRSAIKISLPWRWLHLRPGQSISLPEQSGTWRITKANLEAMIVHLTLEREPSLSALTLAADAGRSLAQADVPHGPSHIVLLDLPNFTDGLASTPQLFVAACGTSAGWKRAALLMSLDGNSTWQEVGSTAAPAIIGQAQSALAYGSAMVVDRINHVDVLLQHEDMALSNADGAALLAGQNLALLGHELIQFERAMLIGPGRYRLSGLWRGRRGAEWAMDSHQSSEVFVLLEGETLQPLPVPLGSAALAVMAQGIGDAVPASASRTVDAAALSPLSPVHLRADMLANGDLRLHWVRRSRDGWRWIDGVDAPLGEETERYQVSISPMPGATRQIEVLAPEWIYTVADQEVDAGLGASAAEISVVQRGTHAVSRPVTLILPL